MTPTRPQELAFLRSVIYASLFDYPLTLDQVHATLAGVKTDRATVATWWRDSALLQATVDHRQGLYFPSGRGDLVATRMRRETLSRQLLDRDRRMLRLVARMPFVRMVALSGSLAHLNAEASADLDLFVIAAPGRVWSVTLATLVITRLLGWRKRMCLNYVISERAMPIEPADLFSANQIIHLRPVKGHDVFARFLDANPFVKAIYPNFEGPRSDASGLKTPPNSAPSLTERIARALYRSHLQARAARWISRDQVRLEDDCLKLHTTSHRASTLQRYEDRVAAALQDAAKVTLAS